MTKGVNVRRSKIGRARLEQKAATDPSPSTDGATNGPTMNGGAGPSNDHDASVIDLTGDSQSSGVVNHLPDPLDLPTSSADPFSAIPSVRRSPSELSAHAAELKATHRRLNAFDLAVTGLDQVQALDDLADVAKQQMRNASEEGRGDVLRSVNDALERVIGVGSPLWKDGGHRWIDMITQSSSAMSSKLLVDMFLCPTKDDPTIRSATENPSATVANYRLLEDCRGTTAAVAEVSVVHCQCWNRAKDNGHTHCVAVAVTEFGRRAQRIVYHLQLEMIRIISGGKRLVFMTFGDEALQLVAGRDDAKFSTRRVYKTDPRHSGYNDGISLKIYSAPHLSLGKRLQDEAPTRRRVAAHVRAAAEASGQQVRPEFEALFDAAVQNFRGYGTSASGRIGGSANTDAQQAQRENNRARGRIGGSANTDAQQGARRENLQILVDARRAAAPSRGADFARRVLAVLEQGGRLDPETKSTFTDQKKYYIKNIETARLFFEAAKPILLHAHETNRVVLPERWVQFLTLFPARPAAK